MSQTLIDVVLLIPVAVIALVVGIWVALASCIAHDKRKARRVRQMVYDRDSWCYQNCRHFDECHSNHKDPDDAWKELEDYCCQCPMAMAVDVWERSKGKC